ncbi:hypothetical protein [Patulibacter defluvii]|uniref:hypothetical protein n=1 Tax=Patulibacter defluvii TaxID=3095358 RepID=UPI002A74C17D|nr:hypothetical protein [Patulibacter sp. DM4]
MPAPAPAAGRRDRTRAVLLGVVGVALALYATLVLFGLAFGISGVCGDNDRGRNTVACVSERAAGGAGDLRTALAVAGVVLAWVGSPLGWALAWRRRSPALALIAPLLSVVAFVAANRVAERTVAIDVVRVRELRFAQDGCRIDGAPRCADGLRLTVTPSHPVTVRISARREPPAGLTTEELIARGPDREELSLVPPGARPPDRATVYDVALRAGRQQLRLRPARTIDLDPDREPSRHVPAPLRPGRYRAMVVVVQDSREAGAADRGPFALPFRIR